MRKNNKSFEKDVDFKFKETNARIGKVSDDREDATGATFNML